MTYEQFCFWLSGYIAGFKKNGSFGVEDIGDQLSLTFCYEVDIKEREEKNL